jgi:hypothetical protein
MKSIDKTLPAIEVIVSGRLDKDNDNHSESVVDRSITGNFRFFCTRK